MKYIVKNCPACMVNPMFRTPDYFCNDIAIEERILHCDSHTDCVIKQVIEKCKERYGKCKRCKASEDYQPTDCLDYCSNDDVIFAEQILQLFDIEEINK